MRQEIMQHLAQDPKLAPLIKSQQLPQLATQETVYFSLNRAIVSQQLSVKAAKTIHDRFLHLFEDGQPDPNILLTFDPETLRSVGLSKQKAGYLQNIARYTLEHKLDEIQWEDRTDQEALTLLTNIKGVGIWTAQMILMFTLHREDIFPVGDLGIQQAMIKLYALEEKGKALLKKMEAIAAPWSPYRTAASRHLWHWKDLQ